MALGNNIVWECRTTGSDTLCSGGFNPANGNFATDGAATSATGNTPVFSSASYNFVAGDVGYHVFIKSGTNWTPGWYEIDSLSGSSAVLKAAIGQGVSYVVPLTTNAADGFQVSTVAGCATTGSPTGATWGLDYSQNTTAKHAFTDLVIDGTTNTKFTSAAKPVGKNFVGNTIKITSGTGFTVQTVEVVSTSGTTATCDKSLGTLSSSGGNGYMGGCFAGPQLASALCSSLTGPRVFIKSGSYTWSSTTANIANGRLETNGTTVYVGYNSYRGDNSSTRPVFTASGIATASMFQTNVGGCKFFNLEVDGASLSNIRGFNMQDNSTYAFNCRAVNCVTGFLNSTNIYSSVADTCTTGFSSTSSTLMKISNSVAKSCTTGFSSGVSGESLDHCISVNCTTGFFANSNSTTKYTYCTAYGGTTGFDRTTSTTSEYFNCVAVSNSGYGFDFNSSSGRGTMFKCASYNTGSGTVRYNITSGISIYNFNFVTLTGDPFTNAASNDFSLNSTSGAGAAIKDLSFAYGTISTTTYNDAGAAQHQSVAAAAGGSWGFG